LGRDAKSRSGSDVHDIAGDVAVHLHEKDRARRDECVAGLEGCEPSVVREWAADVGIEASVSNLGQERLLEAIRGAPSTPGKIRARERGLLEAEIEKQVVVLDRERPLRHTELGELEKIRFATKRV